MNKKFSTLMAGLMLASAFSVGAQTTAVSMENGKSYLLQVTPGTYLAAESNPESSNYGQLTTNTDLTSLKNVVNSTWTVTRATTTGANVYSFVNKATGLALSVDPAAATKAGSGVGATVTLGSGSVKQWAMTSDGQLFAYFKSDSVVYIDQAGKVWKDKVGSFAPSATANGYTLTNPLTLTADDLNSLMRSVNTVDNFFGLTMTPEVSEGQANHLTATTLSAVPFGETEYVSLKAKDKKVNDKQAYVVVDTAYYSGTEASSKLLQFTYDEANAKGRLADSYAYKFTYNVTKDELYVQVKGVKHKSDKANDNGAFWQAGDVLENEYIYMAQLVGTNVLTVNTTETQTEVSPVAADQNVVIKTGANYAGLKLASLEDGVYLIQYKADAGSSVADRNNQYAIANLAGDGYWANQERNQDFNHMPAAQWVVKKLGTTSTSPIAITNREFDDVDLTNVVPASAQLFAVEGQDNQVFYFHNSGKDTVVFTKVADALVKDTKLGYKYATAEEASVETYTFNYLHGLSMDTYLNTPEKDSIVRVDENGDAAKFRLELVVKDDKYGYEDGLVRNVYYIKAYDNSKFGGEDRYLTYDNILKKYVMGTTSTPYFLKENNCVDGKHYYALVEANLAVDGESLVVFDQKIGAAEGTSANYASYKASVDDNTLDLVRGVVEENTLDEIRTSAFAVEVDNSPLYRRFNGEAPEAYGDAANAPLNLKFFRYNNPAEYLFENYASENAYRDGINDKSISFLGVNNAYQFEETETRSYTMFVDTAYVRNNTRMPQYMIGIRPEVVEGDTVWCNATSAHHHETLADSLACDHTVITEGFTRAMYLFNAQDSIDAKNFDYQGKAAYGAANYTRLAFKDAVHAKDTLYILKNSDIKTEDIVLSNDALFADKIALDNNKHKNVVFQFRLIDDENNRFLIESETEQNGAAVLNSKLENVCIAPMSGGWVKIQNGVPVIARFQDFNEAIAQAEIFDVNDEIKYDATANDEVAVESVKVIAGNGQVTIMGAAGKNVTITNILGKVIANQTIASDNATIAVPAGIVAVAVEGEAAVKAVVK